MLAPCKSNNGPHILLCSRGEINQVQILVLGSCKSNTTMHLLDWGRGGVSLMCTNSCSFHASPTTGHIHLFGWQITCVGRLLLFHASQAIYHTHLFGWQITCVGRLVLFHASPTLDQTHLCGQGANHLCGETHVVSCQSNTGPDTSVWSRVNHLCGETHVVSCQSNTGPDTSVCSWGKSLVWRNSCCFLPVQHWTRHICVFWGEITCVEKHMLVSSQSNTGPHSHLCSGSKPIMWRTEQVPYTWHRPWLMDFEATTRVNPFTCSCSMLLIRFWNRIIILIKTRRKKREKKPLRNCSQYQSCRKLPATPNTSKNQTALMNSPSTLKKAKDKRGGNRLVCINTLAFQCVKYLLRLKIREKDTIIHWIKSKIIHICLYIGSSPKLYTSVYTLGQVQNYTHLSASYLSFLAALHFSADTRVFRILFLPHKVQWSSLFLTRLQLSGTSSLFLSVLSNVPWKPFSFQKPLQTHCPEIQVCIVIVWVRVGCMHQILKTCTFKECVSVSYGLYGLATLSIH